MRSTFEPPVNLRYAPVQYFRVKATDFFLREQRQGPPKKRFDDDENLGQQRVAVEAPRLPDRANTRLIWSRALSIKT